MKCYGLSSFWHLEDFAVPTWNALASILAAGEWLSCSHHGADFLSKVIGDCLYHRFTNDRILQWLLSFKGLKSQTKSQHPHQLIIHVEVTEIKKQHCSFYCILELDRPNIIEQKIVTKKMQSYYQFLFFVTQSRTCTSNTEITSMLY